MNDARVTIHVIRLTDATRRALADVAILPYRNTGIPAGPGLWDIPVSDDVTAALERERLPGESDDDLVMRFVRAHRGAKPS